MLEIRARLEAGKPAVIYGRLRLAFDQRQKSRMRATLESGEEVAIALARGEVLRGGDLVVAGAGEVIEIVAERESVMHAECDSAQALTRLAYHLGNRHVPLQVGDRWVRFAADPVLAKMAEGLGAKVSTTEDAFEPEAGAYASHHRHDNESGHGGRIHEFGPHR
jgi:urease accessory protein